MKIFADFLGEQLVTSKFMRNYLEYNGTSAVKWITERTDYSPIIAVKFAFDWYDTFEGWDFWNDIHKKWIEYMKDNNIPYNRSVKTNHKDSLNIQTQKELKDESTA